MRNVFDLMRLDGRVALVTGGAGHIGTAICEAFAEAGANVAVLDLDPTHTANAAAALREKCGIETLALAVDLEQEADVRAAPARVVAELGRLDVVVNCAALVGTTPLKGWGVDFEAQDADTWRRALEVNLTAPFVLVQACTEHLRASGHGAVINIGSIYGVVGPDPKLYGEGSELKNPAAYAASKGGLVQLTRWMSTVLAPTVRVNAISVGGVFRNHDQGFVDRYTARTPLQRMATEEDLKGAALFLASDASAYVTGQNLMVDGGWTAW